MGKKEFVWKSCPFCGGEVRLVQILNSDTFDERHYIIDKKYWDDIKPHLTIGCQNCDMWFDKKFDSIEEANDAWNTRSGR